MQKCSDQKQKDSIQKILDTRLELGLMCINYHHTNPEERRRKINILTTSLNEQLEDYRKSLNEQLQTHQRSNSAIVTTTKTKKRNNSISKVVQKIRDGFSGISATGITPFGRSENTTTPTR